jgi:hypothetical protein
MPMLLKTNNKSIATFCLIIERDSNAMLKHKLKGVR